MEIRLFLRRHQIDSTFIFSLLNYNKVDFSLFVENTLTSHSIIQKEIPEAKNLPGLQIITKNKTIFYDTREEILKSLSINKILKKGISHSAWEQQTYDHLIQYTSPLASSLSKGLFKRFQQSLSIVPNSSTGETIGLISGSFSDAIKLTWKDLQNKDKIKYKKDDFINEIKAWEERLSGQDFHGGKLPNKADFFMYSCLEANWKFCKGSILKIPLVWAWKTNMDKLVDQESKN